LSDLANAVLVINSRRFQFKLFFYQKSKICVQEDIDESGSVLYIKHQCNKLLATNSVADLDPGSGAFLTPGSGIRDGNKSGSGSGIREEQPGSYFLELRNHFFGLKYSNFFMQIPGWKKVDQASRIRNTGYKPEYLRGVPWAAFLSGLAATAGRPNRCCARRCNS
jgi:hypothetical protein